MNKFLLTILLATFSMLAFSQVEKNDEEDSRVFKKENLFAGGGVTVSYFNGVTVLGINPYAGYSITKWLDASVSMNVNYISQSNYLLDGDRVHQTILAPGALVRVYPLKFLYAETQFEHNIIKQKYVPAPNSGYMEDKINYNVNSLLTGIGYASDREYDDDEFYYISISFDLLRRPGSPYTSSRDNPFPIIRAGYNIKLFPNHKKKKQ